MGEGANPQDSLVARAITLVSRAVPIVLVLLWLKFYEQRPFWTLGFTRDGAIMKFLRGVIVGIGMFALVVGLMAVAGGVASGTANGQSGLSALGGIFLLAALWLVQGSSEEIVFRGLLMQDVGARYRPALGVLMATILFALIHSFNPGITVLVLVNIVLVGLFLACYALRESSLWGVCGLHAAWNWVQGSVFGFSVSGQAVPGGSLFNLQTNATASELVTGGVFGPEGSLAATLVLIAVTLVVFFYPQSTSKPG
jgi:membrane protease YdiL (CAAX protease family)